MNQWMYSGKLLWSSPRGGWVLGWNRRRIGRSRFWIGWLSFRHAMHSKLVVK